MGALPERTVVNSLTKRQTLPLLTNLQSTSSIIALQRRIAEGVPMTAVPVEETVVPCGGGLPTLVLTRPVCTMRYGYDGVVGVAQVWPYQVLDCGTCLMEDPSYHRRRTERQGGF